jgi:hypothetical protein
MTAPLESCFFGSALLLPKPMGGHSDYGRPPFFPLDALLFFSHFYIPICKLERQSAFANVVHTTLIYMYYLPIYLHIIKQIIERSCGAKWSF